MMQIQTFVVNYFSENTYLLFDETNEAVIIDCGCMNKQENQQVEDFILQHQLLLRHHLCTHVHVDHLLGAEFIYTTYGLLPETASEDVQSLPDISEQAKLFGLSLTVRPLEIRTNLKARDIVRFGNSTLSVLAVPGHSQGSIAFYSSENNCIFVGDALFSGSIGRTDLWGGNYRQLIDSIHTEILTLPDETIIYSGHGPETTVAFERLNNPYL